MFDDPELCDVAVLSLHNRRIQWFCGKIKLYPKAASIDALMLATA
jgi:hypothetical protein